MLYRWACPSCGKSIRVSLEDVGHPVLCGACGRRATVPPGLGLPGEAMPTARADSSTPATMPPPLSVPSPAAPSAGVDRPEASFPSLTEDSWGTAAEYAGAAAPSRVTGGSRTLAADSAADEDARASARRDVRSAQATAGGRRRTVAMTTAVSVAVGTVTAAVAWLAKPGTGPSADPAGAKGEGQTGAWRADAGPLGGASGGPADGGDGIPSADEMQLHALKARAEADVRAGDPAAAAEAYRRLFALAAGRPSTSPRARRAVLDAMAAADRLGASVPPAAALAAAVPSVPAGERVPGEGTPAAPQATRGPSDLPAVRPTTPGPAGSTRATDAVAVASPAEPSPQAPAQAMPGPATAPVEPLVRLERPAGPPVDDLDARVDRAIRRGAQRLLDAQVADVGRSTLASYAIAAAGQAVADPRLTANGIVMESLLERLKAADLNSTYTRSLRACALSVYNRPKDRRALQADVDWLIVASSGVGNYTYGDRKDGRSFPRAVMPPAVPRRVEVPGGRGDVVLTALPGRVVRPPPGLGDRTGQMPLMWDNSNSQYGLLGVWAGAEAGIEVPNAYWQQVADHWRQTQCADGAWPYGRNVTVGTFTMTCAGVVSTTITHDYLRTDNALAKFAGAPMPPPLAKALDWLDRSADVRGQNLSLDGYAVYGLERVGLATGIKYFGTADWYRELAEQVVAAQGPTGGWDRGGGMGADSVVNTAYAVLFLARGRHPVLMNKVRHAGDWYNRPRDAANVTRFVSRAVERPMNWQVVNLERPGTDWLDAPILYVSGAGPIKFADADYDRFRAYAENGGLIVLHADGGSASFAKWARETFVPKAFPGGMALAPLPPTHGFYRLAAHLPPTVKVEAAGNGSRMWVVLCPDDVAGAWQGRDDKTKRGSFDLMLNLFVYATDNVPPRNRLVTPVVPDLPPGAQPPAATFGVARVRHAGDWDPEPGAWPRFAKLFRWQTGAEAEVRATSAEDLVAGPATRPAQPAGVAGSAGSTEGTSGDPAATGSAPFRPAVAHLTGTAPFALTDAETAGLRKYVEDGGVLLVEACGGASAFATFADETLVPAAFPGLALEDATADQVPLAKTQPVTDDLTKRKVRPSTLGQPAGRLVGLRKGRWGKGWVLVSRFDLTTGLLGCNVSGIVGFSPDYAVGVVKNLLVWSATMRGAEAPAVAAGTTAAGKP